jgi:hypothetical protein
MRLSLAITTLLSVASAAAGIEISPGSLRGKKKSSSPSSNSLSKLHSAADSHTPSFNSTKKSSPLAVVSEPWAGGRPSKSKSKPKPERLAGSIVTIKKQVKKGNSSRHLSSQCIDTPEWVDSYGDGCEWYETNDEPGCPGYGADWDGGMGVANDNCCHCKEGSSTSTTCPKLSDSQCSGDQLCTCPSSGKHLRINAKDLNPSGGDCFACVYPDYGWDCVDDYDCDINNSKCAVVRADYEGPNKPLTNTSTMCIPKEGAEKGMPCYTNQYCASGMCNLLKDGTFNSQHGECTEDPVEQVNPVNCWGDGTLCVGATCNSCCDSYEYWESLAFTACGTEPSWEDGAYCAAGTTCNNCLNGYEYWESLAFTACGTEPCWGDGAACAAGTTCNSCCNSYSWKWSAFFTTCGL